MSITNPALFPAEVESLKGLVDAQLDTYTQFDEDCPARLREAIRYSLLAPGKRIRPLLVLTAAQICGAKVQAALPAACAVEMIHCYSLIHDDLPAMDDDDLRRGRPSCHKQFDEATAILAGDALIPLAFEILSRDIQPPAIAAQCCAALAHAAGPSQLVGGQSDDLSHQFAERDVELLERIHHRKTGALLSTSLIVGSLVAEAPTELTQSLRVFGKHLGLAFQIVDDLLDLRGESDKIGKRTQKDTEMGKMTYPSVIGEQESERRAFEMAEQAIAALAPFGPSAKPLHDIAQFVVQRTQ